MGRERQKEMPERSQTMKPRAARTRFGLGSHATEHATYITTATNAGMQALSSRRWQSASLKAKVEDLDEHIDFIVRLCPDYLCPSSSQPEFPNRLRTLFVEMTNCEIARVGLQWGKRWLYSSTQHPHVVFELKRASG